VAVLWFLHGFILPALTQSPGSGFAEIGPD
jgi:hypothetical protein